ncbi:MAG: M28 family peptidase [Bacteroidales bacterium]|nr:M28 family peptidase [Bacteroidales bacterium]
MKNLIAALLLIFLFSCSENEVPENMVDVTNMKRITEILSSDAFMGRQPFTEGEKLTIEFIAGELKKIGFEPPFNGSYFQQVPMYETTSTVSNPVTFNIKGKKLQLNAPDQIAISSPIPQELIDLKNSKLVFAGFGIKAPDYGWDDYKDIDLEGKTVVVFVNDPGLYSENPSFFRGREMTFYGRWTYKYEEAARQGASAILIIHDPVGAGYEFNVPRNSSISSRLFIDDESDEPKCKITGWLTDESARKIFGGMGYDIDSLRAQAVKQGFKPFEIDASFSATITNKIKWNTSTNVAGILKGSVNPDEAVVITAHWDHFGIGEKQNGDSIYNGAVDNGTTMAWAFEIGRVAASLRTKPERSIILLFPTAEEQGLTGSEYYTRFPVIPMDKTIACLNNDMMVPRGKMKDVTMIGLGYSSLDSIYGVLAAKQERYLLPDPNSHTGLFFRSDHFPFFKAGVPSIWAYGCYDSREHGKEWALETWNYFINNVYHRPADNYNPDWDWSGVVEDTKLALNVTLWLTKSSNPKPYLTQMK